MFYMGSRHLRFVVVRFSQAIKNVTISSKNKANSGHIPENADTNIPKGPAFGSAKDHSCHNRTGQSV